MQHAIAARVGAKKVRKQGRLVYFGTLILIGTAMFLAVVMSGFLTGNTVTSPPLFVPIWLPTGLGLGILLVGGLRYWWGIPLWGVVLGLLAMVLTPASDRWLVNAWSIAGPILGVSLLILGEVLLIYFLARAHVRSTPGEPLFERAAIVRLLGLAVFGAMLGKAAFVSYLSVTTWYGEDSEMVWSFWGKHVLGDVIGILLLTPWILFGARWLAERRLEKAEVRR